MQSLTYLVTAGYTDDEINSMLDTYGYADGGRAGFKSGDFVYSKRIKDEYEANVKEGYEGSIDDYIIEFYGEEYLDPSYAKGGRVGFSKGGLAKILEL